ncbi:MAG: exodeoxyribonuclease VII small subunit [Clostridiaceae bacterium]|nr:exodeoxyribonuclease VII small subunit [Clostridiaceae bacterium]
MIFVNFETRIKNLSEIVAKLEKGDLTLDEAMELFEDGIKITKECTKMLDEAEQKVAQLIRELDGSVSEIPFIRQD